jgi:transposase
MGKQRTHYDKVFKENAVKLGLERKNVSELAQELGIGPPFFYIVSGKSFGRKEDMFF